MLRRKQPRNGLMKRRMKLAMEVRKRTKEGWMERTIKKKEEKDQEKNFNGTENVRIRDGVRCLREGSQGEKSMAEKSGAGGRSWSHALRPLSSAVSVTHVSTDYRQLNQATSSAMTAA
ncbi:hypothetical protein E2C01_059189 [Portunus trituberculatus]|uniref:Uncharacterized protein n=1 Tax=Portunus trituberculatus TaxID=210409 RepID=A0A5B7H655_PORTR|nr:hypothetical protein [Portunus trituberculatus]